MLISEQVATKRVEAQAQQQEAMQQVGQIEAQRQALLEQRNQLMAQIHNLQGRIEALTMVLTGEGSQNGVIKEEAPDATQGR